VVPTEGKIHFIKDFIRLTRGESMILLVFCHACFRVQIGQLLGDRSSVSDPYELLLFLHIQLFVVYFTILSEFHTIPNSI
jgi:hypothetical protein